VKPIARSIPSSDPPLLGEHDEQVDEQQDPGEDAERAHGGEQLRDRGAVAAGGVDDRGLALRHVLALH
jgi:hypothetical protein